MDVQLIYILSSMLTFLCSFVLLFSFRKQFKDLTLLQKSSLLLLIISVLIPFVVGFLTNVS